jgi:methanogenic corrinoid protein MtbC1
MELIEKLKEAIINGDEKKTRILTKDLINKGIDVQEIIDKGLKHALDSWK